MPIPWESKVKNSGKLLIYDEISVGAWSTIFDLALAAFNANTKKIGLEVVKATSKGSANVVMKLMRLTGLHGKAALGRDPDRNVLVEVEIFLPDNPQASAPSGPELASTDVMLVLAVHELVHAAGLTNDDHGGDGVFYFPLSHQGGKLYVREKGKNQKPMPPVRFDSHLIKKLKNIW